MLGNHSAGISRYRCYTSAPRWARYERGKVALGIRDNGGSLRPVFFSEECSKPLRRCHRHEKITGGKITLGEWREKFEQCHEQFADDVSLRKRGLNWGELIRITISVVIWLGFEHNYEGYWVSHSLKHDLFSNYFFNDDVPGLTAWCSLRPAFRSCRRQSSLDCYRLWRGLAHGLWKIR